MSEGLFRLIVFGGSLAIVAAWEALAPDRPLRLPRLQRWLTHFGLGLLGMGLSRLLGASLTVGAALWAHGRGWGLLPHLGVLPLWAIPVSFLALDLAVYAQHVATHAWKPLWRLHRVHHADLDMDVSTGLRFHPIEILVSQVYKATLVLLLGAPVLAVIAFETALSLGSLFTHANGRMPASLERVLRGVVVTPTMHTLHHSTLSQETDSNFGFFLSCWDRLFRTYRATAEPGLVLGLKGVPDLGFGRLLAWPFRGSGLEIPGTWKSPADGTSRQAE